MAPQKDEFEPVTCTHTLGDIGLYKESGKKLHEKVVAAEFRMEE